MADVKNKGNELVRELGIPAVAGVVAAGAGLVLTRHRPTAEMVPDVKNGVGDLVEDLRGKLDAVIGKRNGGRGEELSGEPMDKSTSDVFAERRRARAQRRSERRGRSD